MNPVVDLALERFDLLGYLLGRGADSVKADEWELDCPICGRRKLVVNAQKRHWKCWRCFRQTPPDVFGRRHTVAGAGGLVSLLQMLESWTRAQVLVFLLAGGASQGASQRIAGRELRALPVDFSRPAKTIPYPEGATNYVDGTMAYLLHRGVTPEDVRNFGLFWCDRGRYRGRAIFPVYEQGRLVYFQGRAQWESSDPKFRKSLNPPKAPGDATSDQVLFNLDRARCFPRVAVTEGPIDAIHVGDDAVCTFGKRMSPVQVYKLLSAGVQGLDLMWDADAWEEAKAQVDFLSQFFSVRAIYVPGKDPGVHPRAYLTWLREQSALPERRSRLARI